MNSRALILGGCGFLGSHLAERLLDAGYRVRIFDRFEAAKTNILPFMHRIELVSGDFANQAAVAEATRDVDVVYHLISTTLPKSSNDDMPFDIDTNLIPTLHFLDACQRNRVRKVVFASSGGTVYGIPNSVPVHEDHPTNPLCSYGIHKLAIEKYLALYHQLHQLDYAVMRIANLFGPRQRSDGSQGVVAVFLGHILRDEPIQLWGDGSVIRDYIYVTDVVDAALALAPYQGSQRIFNIGGGVGLSLLEVIKAIGKTVQRKPHLTFAPARPLDVPINVLDITRAATLLKWQPKISFEQGLQLTADYLNAPRAPAAPTLAIH